VGQADSLRLEIGRFRINWVFGKPLVRPVRLEEVSGVAGGVAAIVAGPIVMLKIVAAGNCD